MKNGVSDPSVRIVLVLRDRRLESGSAGQGVNLPELLIGEVSFLPGQFPSLGALGVEILDHLVVKVRDAEGHRVTLIAVTDVENFPHGFGAIAMLGEVLRHGDRVGKGFAQLVAETVEAGRAGVRAEHEGEPGRCAHRLIAVGEIKAHASSRELVEVRSLGMPVAVAAESGLQIVDEDQKDVGLRRAGCRQRETDGEEERKEQARHGEKT
jgi:hypothetical protein